MASSKTTLCVNAVTIHLSAARMMAVTIKESGDTLRSSLNPHQYWRIPPRKK